MLFPPNVFASTGPTPAEVRAATAKALRDSNQVNPPDAFEKLLKRRLEELKNSPPVILGLMNSKQGCKSFVYNHLLVRKRKRRKFSCPNTHQTTLAGA